MKKYFTSISVLLLLFFLPPEAFSQDYSYIKSIEGMYIAKYDHGKSNPETWIGHNSIVNIYQRRDVVKVIAEGRYSGRILKGTYRDGSLITRYNLNNNPWDYELIGEVRSIDNKTTIFAEFDKALYSDNLRLIYIGPPKKLR